MKTKRKEIILYKNIAPLALDVLLSDTRFRNILRSFSSEKFYSVQHLRYWMSSLIYKYLRAINSDCLIYFRLEFIMFLNRISVRFCSNGKSAWKPVTFRHKPSITDIPASVPTKKIRGHSSSKRPAAHGQGVAPHSYKIVNGVPLIIRPMTGVGSDAGEGVQPRAQARKTRDMRRSSSDEGSEMHRRKHNGERMWRDEGRERMWPDNRMERKSCGDGTEQKWHDRGGEKLFKNDVNVQDNRVSTNTNSVKRFVDTRSFRNGMDTAIESKQPTLRGIDSDVSLLNKIAGSLHETEDEEKLYGIHPVLLALQAGKRKMFEIYCKRGLEERNPKIKQIYQLAAAKNITFHSVKLSVIRKAFSNDAVHQGIYSISGPLPVDVLNPEDIDKLYEHGDERYETNANAVVGSGAVAENLSHDDLDGLNVDVTRNSKTTFCCEIEQSADAGTLEANHFKLSIDTKSNGEGEVKRLLCDRSMEESGEGQSIIDVNGALGSDDTAKHAQSELLQEIPDYDNPQQTIEANIFRDVPVNKSILQDYNREGASHLTTESHIIDSVTAIPHSATTTSHVPHVTATSHSVITSDIPRVTHSSPHIESSPPHLSRLMPLIESSAHLSSSMPHMSRPTPQLSHPLPHRVARHRLWLLLDRVVDPMNLGAVLRSSCYFGVARVLLSPSCAPLNPVVSKASSGAVELLPVYQLTQVVPTLARLKYNGWQVVAAVSSAAAGGGDCAPAVVAAANLKLKQDTVLIVGNEGLGVSADVMACADVYVTIPAVGPMAASVGCLNVSAATAVLLHSVL